MIAAYDSPLGPLYLTVNGDRLVGLAFANGGPMLARPGASSTFRPVFMWLDDYFAGKRPDPLALPIFYAGTPFQHRVWSRLLEIPFGRTATYGEIARSVSRKTGAGSCARAVGQAVGKNPLGIIIPCHRVVGANGRLGGFSAGLAIKVRLLRHEGILA